VKALSWGAGSTDPAPLERALEEVAPPPAPEPQRPNAGGFEPFEHANTGDRRDRNPALLVRNCPQLLAAGLPSATRHSWWHMLGVMRFCQQGREAAHLISQADKARYNARELDRQFDSIKSGPPRCSTFEGANPEPCSRCRFRDQVSSPVQLNFSAPPPEASEAPEAPELEPGVPDKPDETLVPYKDEEFEVEPGRGVFQLIPSKIEGEPPRRVLINRHEFYLRDIHVETEEVKAQVFMVFLVKSPSTPFRVVRFSMTENYAGQGMTVWLGNNRLLPVSPDYNKQMRRFMGSYIASLQERDATERKTHFGWGYYTETSTGKHKEGFVIGNVMYTPDGRKNVALDERCERIARREYISVGSLDAWSVVPKLYRVLDQKEGQLFMCASFAAPFMRLGTGTAANLIMHLWDARGGKGKTSLLQAVNSVWGHPVALTSSKSDTLSARYQVLTLRHNLPYCMDELTTMKDHELSNLLYDVANGMEKRKSKSSGADLVSTGEWSTITMLTSNRSVYEILRGISMQTTAESMRVIEIPCRFQNYAGTEAGPRIESVMRLLHENYGLAGPAFMEGLITRRPEAFERVAEQALEWDNRVRCLSEERFWTYGFGIVLAVGRLACEEGYLDYDIDALGGWIEDELLPAMRAGIGSSTADGSSIMTMFLNENLDSTLVVVAADRPKRPDRQNTVVTVPEEGDGWLVREPRRSLHIRLELDTRTFYVGARHLEAWCREKRLSVEAVLEGLMETGKYKKGERFTWMLGRGVGRLSTGGVICYKFRNLEAEHDYAKNDPK
jgi:hypothetical protein